jgi:acetoin utilization deacetylase AcuC-like enzyme
VQPSSDRPLPYRGWAGSGARGFLPRHTRMEETPVGFGYVFDEQMLAHETGMVSVKLPDGRQLELGPHPSGTPLTAGIHRLLAESGFVGRCTRIAARTASLDELLAVHAAPYVERVQRMSEAGGGNAGDVAPVGPASYAAARHAAGSTIAAVEAVLDGTVHGAYVLTRPPGHHALPDRGMGYCLFNNVAMGVRAAQRHGCRRVMVLDWDVHHGNGTQGVFEEDADVLFVSLHQEDWYPRDSGRLEDNGTGAGLGTTVNVPLPPGTGDRGYLTAFETIVAPVARRFRPDLLLISAGQDPAMLDPLGRMLVSAAGFLALGAHAARLAAELCAGRVVAVQEGGYSLYYTPVCTLKMLEGLTGLVTGVEDPYRLSTEQRRAESVLSAETQLALDRACAAFGTR